MGNLVRFFLRYNGFILFLFLEIVCLVLISLNSEYHQNIFINSANSVSGGMYERSNNLKNYFALRGINDSLASENAKLREGWGSMKEFQILSKDTIADTQVSQRYTVQSAKVIRKTITKSNNLLTINLGKVDGVRPEMGVMGPLGVVGVVKDVGKNFSTVITQLHSSFKIRGEIRSNGYSGDVQWEGKHPDRVRLEHVPKHVNLKKGDTVVTTPYSGLFPEGIPIGFIHDFDKSEGKNFCDIELDIATNFHTLKYVYLVDDLNKREIDSLQNLTEGGQ